METMPERSCRRLSGANHFRNTFGPLIDPHGKTSNWQSEIYPHYHVKHGPNNSDLQPREFSSDHNIIRFTADSKLSSDESFPVDLEITEIDNYPDYQTGEKLARKNRREKRIDSGYGKIENNSASMNREDQRRMKDSGTEVADQFAGVSVQEISKTLIAEEKLKKLKELQRRREFNERYYSREIRKLINEYYRSAARNSGDSVSISVNNQQENENENENEKATPSQRQISTLKESDKTATNLLVKSLEPCGTMTTITRLDCGCMQETTRPIFTTSRGRIESRNCPHGENISALDLKLNNSSSLPREHSLSSKSNFLRPQSRFASRRKLIVANSNSQNFNPSYSGVVRHRPPRIAQLHDINNSPAARRADDNFARGKTTSSSGDPSVNKNFCDYKIRSSLRSASNTLQLGSNNKNPAARCNSEMSPKARLIKRPGTAASSSFVRDNRHQSTRNLSPLRKYSDTSTD